MKDSKPNGFMTLVVSDRGDFQGRHADSGFYTGRHLSPVPSGVVCPYCRVEMIEARPTEVAKRIVRIVRRFKRAQNALAVAQAIPETHRVVACRDCRSVFTVPRCLESALSVAALDPHADSTGTLTTREKGISS